MLFNTLSLLRKTASVGKTVSALRNRAYEQVVQETNATTGNVTDYLYEQSEQSEISHD